MPIEQIFPNLPDKKDFKLTIAKLRGDDVHIMERLYAKYGDDVDKMYRDIKINYMQWSPSELRRFLRAYKTHHLKSDQ